MTRKTSKTLIKTLAAGAVLALGVVALPTTALAAVGDTHVFPLFTSTPSGTAADRSWTASAGIGGAGQMGADDWGRSAIGTITEYTLTESKVQHWDSPPTPSDRRADAQRLGTFTAPQTDGGPDVWRYVVASPYENGLRGFQTSNPVAEYRHRILAPQPTLTLNLATQFPELGLNGFYVAGGNAQTGWLSSTTEDCGNLTGGGAPLVNCAAMQGPDYSSTGNGEGEPFSARGTMTGIELDLTAGDWNRGGTYFVTVVGFTASGLQVPIRVELAVAAAGGAPTAGALTYSTPVNVPVTIPEADLTAAVGWRTNVERSVSVLGLPASVTAVPGGYSFVSAVPTTEAFGFRGTERQAPAGLVDSPDGTVTVMALAVEEPEVITAPTVRDFAFPAPLAAGVPVTVDVVALTEGEGFNSAEWALEASDAVAWSAQGGILTLTPEGDREALLTSVRWASLIDPAVTSNWASISAPAAEPTPEPTPVPEPEPTPTPEPTPEPKPTPTPTPTPEPTPVPTPSAPAQPVAPSVIKTGVEASPAGFAAGLAAVLGCLGILTLTRRFAQR